MKTVKQVIAGEEFSHWRTEHERMQHLQTIVEQALRAYNISADSCCIDRIVDEELRLYTISAAAAVSIRQILPTLQQTLNHAGIPVRRVQVSVFQMPD